MAPPRRSCRRRLPTVLFAVLVVSATSAARSEPCDAGVFSALGERLHVPRLASGEAVASHDCKAAPDDPRVTLAVVTWDNGHTQDYSKGFVVAEVDEAAGRVLADLAGETSADGSTPLGSGVHIDTAPYLLAPGVRAFGVDLVQYVPRCADGGAEQERTLYVREGRRLRPVLLDQPMSGGWIVDGGCGDSEVKQRFDVTIAISPHTSHGWHDLAVTTAFSLSSGEPSARRAEHARVAYDGHAYAVVRVEPPEGMADATAAKP